MRKSKHFLFTCAFALVVAVLVQAQLSGFISIDCGSSDTSSYTDETTGIAYLPEANFIESGVNADLSPEFKLQTDEKQLWNVRSFPEGKRNCYTLRPSLGKGTRYLIRARFLYGNYDSKGLVPAFALYLGVDLWDVVLLEDPARVESKEIVHVPSSDYVHVCLVNTGNGVPFISVLELRPLSNVTYATRTGTGLQLSGRFDFASNSDRYMRYKDDIYDRLWSPLTTDVWKPLNASGNGERSMTKNLYSVPFSVMSTAYTRNVTTGFMGVVWSRLSSLSEYYFYIHFAELEMLERNQSREFNVFIAGDSWYGQLSPAYLTEMTIFSVSGIKPDNEGSIRIWLNKTENSTLPPLLNALEIYELKELPQLQTDQTDVEAISNIESVYELHRNSWQGDPCAPKDYMWDGLNCSYNGNFTHRIISLNLSSSGLTGEISPFIAGLTMLEYLDLSNNSLSGTLPEYLANLPFLRVLNVKGNNLKGPIPSVLLDRSKNGLSLSVDESVTGNELSPTPSPKTETSSSSAHCLGNNKLVTPLVASVFAYSLRFVV